MRQTPWRRDQNTALLLTVLTVCALLLMLAPGIGAAPARTMTEFTHGQMGSREAQRVQNDMNRGIVTDDDGFIGNGTHGADAPQGSAALPNPAQDGRNSRMNGQSTADGNNGTARNGGVAGSAENGAPLDGNTGNGYPNNSDGNLTANTGNSSGVLGWIIAIIVLVAIALVVLALVPKRDPSRK